jgi:hypothetical protein
VLLHVQHESKDRKYGKQLGPKQPVAQEPILAQYDRYGSFDIGVRCCLISVFGDSSYPVTLADLST